MNKDEITRLRKSAIDTPRAALMVYTDEVIALCDMADALAELVDVQYIDRADPRWPAAWSRAREVTR